MKLAPHNPIKYGFDNGDDDSATPPAIPEEYLPASTTTTTTTKNAEGGQKQHQHFSKSFDRRLWIFHRRWAPPEHVPVVATLMIVHGTVDHSGVYAELAEKLAPSGIAVFAMDMRGWGLSDGESMYVDDMDTFVEDVESMYQGIHNEQRYQDVPQRFLLGKSLGGTVTAYCVAKYPKHWTGLLGLSGAYQVDPNLVPSPYLVSVLRGLAWIYPKLAFKKLFDEHLIVSDEGALEAWRRDPLCSKDRVRIGYIVNLLECMDALPSQVVPKLQHVPMLMMVGDADQVVTKSGHELMVQQGADSGSGRSEDEKNIMSKQQQQLKVYPGGYHNLLAEPALKDQVMEDIQTWILKRVTAA